jgi:hypothetical protein
VCTSHPPAGNDLVFFGELVLDVDLKVREGDAISRDVPLYALEAVYVVGKAGVMQGVVLCKELLRFGEVSATEDFVEPSADEDLVLFRRRERPFLDLPGSYSLLNLYPQGNAAKGRA